METGDWRWTCPMCIKPRYDDVSYELLWYFKCLTHMHNADYANNLVLLEYIEIWKLWTNLCIPSFETSTLLYIFFCSTYRFHIQFISFIHFIFYLFFLFIPLLSCNFVDHAKSYGNKFKSFDNSKQTMAMDTEPTQKKNPPHTLITWNQEAATCAEITSGHQKNTKSKVKSTMSNVDGWH